MKASILGNVSRTVMMRMVTNTIADSPKNVDLVAPHWSTVRLTALIELMKPDFVLTPLPTFSMQAVPTFLLYLLFFCFR